MLVGLLRESSAVAFGFGHLKRTFCAINEQNRSVAEGQTLRHRGAVRGVRDTLSGWGFQSCQSFPGVRKKRVPPANFPAPLRGACGDVWTADSVAIARLPAVIDRHYSYFLPSEALISASVV